MFHKIKLAAYFAITTFFLLNLTGCGYQIRSWKSWPLALSQIQLQQDNMPTNVNNMLTLFLHSMHVQINQQSHLKLAISKYKAHQSLPISKTSNVPSTISFSLSLTFAIYNHNNICIKPFTLSSSYSQLEPSTTVTQSFDPDIQIRVMQNIIEQLYQKLTSIDVMNQLHSSICQNLQTQQDKS